MGWWYELHGSNGRFMFRHELRDSRGSRASRGNHEEKDV
jgi:hypothetical protein